MIPSQEFETLIVTDDECSERLDQLLVKRYGGAFSRTYFQRLIEQGCVLLNGELVKKRNKPKPGDEIEVEFELSPEIKLKPEAIELDILFEDPLILVINKPAGMVVHPAPGNWTGTFVNGLLHHCQLSIEDQGSLRPGIVHRLDKDTSGVLIAAKTTAAHQKLVAAFASRTVRKEYLAVCIGNPGKITINAPIGRHPIHRKQMAVIEQGRNAITHVEPLHFDGKLCLVRVLLETGRTHQIRVHLKHCGTPILGDPIYGYDKENRNHGIHRQLLHARSLCLNHPITNELMTFEAPIPKDMALFVK